MPDTIMDDETSDRRSKVTLNMSDEIHRQGRLMARRDRRTFSAFIEVLIERAIKEEAALMALESIRFGEQQKGIDPGQIPGQAL